MFPFPLPTPSPAPIPAPNTAPEPLQLFVFSYPSLPPQIHNISSRRTPGRGKEGMEVKSRPGLDKSSPGGYTKQQSRALQLAVGSGLTYFIRQPSPCGVAVVPFCDTYRYGKSERMKRNNHGHLIHLLSESVADRSPLLMQRPVPFRGLRIF